METLSKSTIILFLLMMTQCQTSSPSKWTEQQVNDWFETGSFLNGLELQPDNSINRRIFVVHYHQYKDIWDRAFTFLKDSDLATMPLGRVELGDGMYANVDEYQPREHSDIRFEAHQKYIDIQCIVAGKEIISLTNLGNMNVTEPYDVGKDIVFGTATQGDPLRAAPGSFFIFFPDDAHRPCMKDGDDGDKVRKVVIKVPL